MSSTRMILPSYDPACGRVFHADRKGAEAHRVAMEIWYRAVGREVPGRRLAAYRCKRCAGYHVALKKVRPAPSLFVPAFRGIDYGGPVAAWPPFGAVS